nr:hypothetical protein [Tanacetum cinerariifolium]
MKRLINSEYRGEIKIEELKGNFNSMSIEINKKEKLLQLEQLANLSTYPSKRLNSFCYDDDDDDKDYTIAIMPVLSIEEPDNSLNQFEDFSESNDEFSSTDDDSFSIDNIDYVKPSPLDSELVSSEVMEIVIPEDKEIEDDNLCEKLLKRSDFYEFTDELIPFISPPEYDCFLFKVEPNSRDFTKDVMEDISLTKEP